jgi:PadR family transcriptional regulator PadR
MDTQLKKGVMDMCVLYLLEKKDYYGYELVQKISEIISLSEGTLYPILKRLKDDGYLETYLQESKEGPSRKYYSLTKKGKMKSKELHEEWKEFSKKINKILKEK